MARCILGNYLLTAEDEYARGQLEYFHLRKHGMRRFDGWKRSGSAAMTQHPFSSLITSTAIVGSQLGQKTLRIMALASNHLWSNRNRQSEFAWITINFDDFFHHGQHTLSTSVLSPNDKLKWWIVYHPSIVKDIPLRSMYLVSPAEIHDTINTTVGSQITNV